MPPGPHGITMVIDTGLPTGAFTDVIESHGQLIDVVKFGWGTAMVTKDMDRKAAVLREAGVDFYFGGTLFEHFLWTGRLVAYRAALLTPADWVDALNQDLAAGASLVITEARESGRSGIARADGHMRDDVLGAVLASVNPRLVMFEAPTKDLQVELIRTVGPAVNLGNIATSDVIAVETLRRGLRGDTLLDLTTGSSASYPGPSPARTARTAA